jgi:nucleotide-binding universal stress UspA family protein
MVDIEEIDAATRKSAEGRAEEGAALARAAGLDAQPRVCSQATTTAAAILSAADEVGASAIVIRSRGLTGRKSLLLGSVSHAVIQHADPHGDRRPLVGRGGRPGARAPQPPVRVMRMIHRG